MQRCYQDPIIKDSDSLDNKGQTNDTRPIRSVGFHMTNQEDISTIPSIISDREQIQLAQKEIKERQGQVVKALRAMKVYLDEAQVFYEVKGMINIIQLYETQGPWSSSNIENCTVQTNTMFQVPHQRASTVDSSKLILEALERKFTRMIMLMSNQFATITSNLDRSREQIIEELDDIFTDGPDSNALDILKLKKVVSKQFDWADQRQI